MSKFCLETLSRVSYHGQASLDEFIDFKIDAERGALAQRLLQTSVCCDDS